MILQEQIDFLCGLGERLDRWTSPGDVEDRYVGKQPLWNAAAKKYVRAPARVIDVLLARWVLIKDFTTQEPVNFILNPAQRHFERNRTGRDILTKAGRGGFTTLEMMRALIEMCTRQGFTAVLITHDQHSAQDFFLQVRYAYDHLVGGELRKALFEGGALQDRKANVREIYLPELNSHYFVDTAGNFAPAEGASIQYLICDEMARWIHGDPKQIVATLLSHLTGERTEATLLSRPFGQTGEFYERYWRAKRGEDAFRPHFIEWWYNRRQRKQVPSGFELNDEEQELRARYARWRAGVDVDLPAELPLESIAWRRTAMLDMRDKFPQEFAEDETQCFLGSGNCPFSATSIDAVTRDATPVLERTEGAGESENGLLRWRDPEPDETYTLFVDVAGTLGTSRIAMELIRNSDGEQCAEWVGRSDATAAAETVASLARRFGKTVVAVESNLGEISATVMARLASDPNNFKANSGWPRLYRRQDSGGQWQLGWKTTPQNRPDMLDTFAGMWADYPQLFHSGRLAREVKKAVRNGDRIEAGRGGTDDLLMAMAGAQKVRLLSVARREREPVVEFISSATSKSREERGWTKVGR